MVVVSPQVHQIFDRTFFLFTGLASGFKEILKSVFHTVNANFEVPFTYIQLDTIDTAGITVG